MTFEEKFPSLKGMLTRGYDIVYDGFGKDNWVIQGAIEHECLDKQRVREAIDKVVAETGNVMAEMVGNRIKKELGL